MAGYDNTFSTPTIVISGYDLRRNFGFEGTDVNGRYSLKFRRRSINYPNFHGTRSQGGVYEPVNITVSGWMPKTNIAAFKRFLIEETSISGKFGRKKYLQFYDDQKIVWVFDTVEEFSITPLTKHWYSDTDVAVSFTVMVTDAFSENLYKANALQDNTIFYTSFAGAAAATPMFVVPKIYNNDRGKLMRDFVMRVGPSTNFNLTSAEHSCVMDFNGSMIAKTVEGTDSATSSDGLHAPTNLLTNGYFEAGDTASSWTATGCTATIIGYVESERTLPGYAKMLTGTQGCMIDANNATNSFTQSFSVTSGKDYVVRGEFWKVQGNLSIKINDGGSDIVTKTYSVGSNNDAWKFFEFVFRATATASWSVIFTTSSSTGTYMLNRVVIAESLLVNGSFDNGVLSWSTSVATLTSEPTTVLTGTSGKATYSGGGYFSQSFATATDTVYYLSGWAYMASSDTAELLITNDGSAGQTSPTLSFQCKLGGDQWTRFSTFFYVRTGASDVIRFSVAVDTTSVVYFDDVSLTPLTKRTGGVFYEPAGLGQRLQVPIGEVVKIKDFSNQTSHSIVAKYKPYLLTQQGCATVCVVAYSYNNCVTTVQEGVSTSQFTFSMLHTSDGSGATERTRIRGSALDSTYIADFKMSSREFFSIGTRVQAENYTDNTLNTMSIYHESPTGTAFLPFSVTRQAHTTTIWGSTNAYETVLLGDIGAWDAFWIVNYDLSDEGMVSDTMANDAPKNRNKKISYSGTLNSGEYVIINTERYTVEKITVTDVATTNAYASITGDMLQFFGEKPVVYSTSAIKSFSLTGKMLQ
jgi:hypothetical protein